MRYRTILIIAAILAAALVAVLGWRPTAAAVRKIVTNLAKTSIKTANNNGLVGFWNFDDCDTCTTANDISGSGNQGTVTDANNSGLRNRVAGKINNALNLDGTDDGVNLGLNPFSNAQLTNGTLSLWFRADTFNPTNYNCAFNMEGVVYMCPNNGVMKIDVRSTTGEFSAGSTLSTGTWYHFALTWDGTTARVYQNGAQIATQLTGGPDLDSYSRNAYIGLSWSGTSVPFDGLIDEVRIYNRALTAAEVRGLFENTKRLFVNMPQNNQLKDGLVGMWSFNGPDMNWALSTAEARDTSGNGNHGDVTNFGQSAARPGIVGQALSFDGSDDDVTVTISAPLQISGAFTLSFWFYARGSSSDAGLVGTGITTGYQCTHHNGATLYCYIQGGGNSVNTAVAQNVWTHVAWDWDGTTNANGMKLYVNGALAAQGTSNQASMSGWGNFRVGNESTRFNGIIDEVRVYNRALSVAEIALLYNAGRRE